MKKNLVLVLLVVVLFSSSAFVLIHKTGEAGKTGAPGEQTCAGGGCHSGGFSSSFNVSISSTPAFTLNQFEPSTTYTIDVTVSAVNFNNFGFGCEILNSNNTNAGTMQSPGAGVQLATYPFNGRRNATHTVPKAGTNNAATFTFEWVSPTTDTTANFYICGNAVNLNNSTTGDKPIPTTLFLTAVPKPIDTSSGVGLREPFKDPIIQMSVFPNPAKDLAQISFHLNETQVVEIVLCDLNGKVLKQFLKEKQNAGSFSKILDIHEIPSGIYFIKVNDQQKKSKQKLLVIE